MTISAPADQPGYPPAPKAGDAPAGAYMQLVANPLVDRTSGYDRRAAAIVNRDQARRALDLISRCPMHGATPLRPLADLAARLGVASLLVKDETRRLGLTSFKALGGAYAVLRQAELAPDGRLVFATATDGNHGISVATGARIVGGRAVIFLPAHVSPPYVQTMQALGAEVIPLAGDYDEAVAVAEAAAARNGWTLVADTTDLESSPVTLDVMAGYGVLVEECIDQLEAGQRLTGPGAVTHVFVQAGVGGLAAALAGGFWERLGPARPIVVVVEPVAADCLFQTARAGAITDANGDLATSMTMLSCGRASRMAWTVLCAGADHFMLIDDACAENGARAWSEALPGGTTTPSGAAGLGALIALAANRDWSASIGLTAASVVLAVCTESPADPTLGGDLAALTSSRHGPSVSGAASA